MVSSTRPSALFVKAGAVDRVPKLNWIGKGSVRLVYNSCVGVNPKLMGNDLFPAVEHILYNTRYICRAIETIECCLCNLARRRYLDILS